MYLLSPQVCHAPRIAIMSCVDLGVLLCASDSPPQQTAAAVVRKAASVTLASS